MNNLTDRRLEFVSELMHFLFSLRVNMFFRFGAFSTQPDRLDMLFLNTCNASAISAISSEPLVAIPHPGRQRQWISCCLETHKATYDPTANVTSR